MPDHDLSRIEMVKALERLEDAHLVGMPGQAPASDEKRIRTAALDLIELAKQAIKHAEIAIDLLDDWSQEELAHQSGKHRTYISSIERGVRNPTITVLHSIAVAMDISVSELLVGLKKSDRSD